MESMKSKRIFYNLFIGVLGQIITILLGLALPRFFITSFGSEINGLISSITQIYVYINLLEAGVGTATLQALYKPIASDDKKEINSILSATSAYYKKTGYLYLLSIFIFAIVYPLAFKTSIDNFTVFLVIVFSGLGGVVNYFFHGKYRILLEAEGKNYIVLALSTVVNILTSITKIVLIINGFDVIAVQFSFFVVSLLQVFVIGYIIKKDYKWINLNAQPNYNSINQKNSVLIHQVSYMIFSNTDVLILTMFTNLKVVSVYTIYSLFFRAISQILSIANNSGSFYLGQIFSKDKSKFSKLIDLNEFIFYVLSFSSYITLFVGLIPFLKIYTNGFSDISYIDINLAILFLLIEIVKVAKPVMNSVVSVSGHFKQTQNRAIIEMSINIIVSIIGVKFLGIYGVLIGTIIALLYRSNDFVLYANKIILNRSCTKSYLRWIFNVVILSIIIYMFSFINLSFYTYFDALIKYGLIFIIVFCFVFTVNCILFKEDFKLLLKIIKTKTI